jgi:hypothetical protein
MILFALLLIALATAWTDFNPLLGSKMREFDPAPSPGVHPRLFFTEKDRAKYTRTDWLVSEALQRLKVSTGLADRAFLYWLNPGSTPPALEGYTDIVELAVAYDFLYNWMTENQRNQTLAKIAEAASTHLSMDGDVTSAWVEQTQIPVLAQLAIYGEPGSNVPIVRENCRRMRKYASTWGAYKDGSTRNGMGYASLQQGWTTQATFAMSRAGVCGNLFDPNVSHYATAFQQYIFAVAPFGGTAVGHDDGVQIAGGPGFSDYPYAVKYMFPDNAWVDWGYRMFIQNEKRASHALWIAIAGMAPSNSSLPPQTPKTKFFFNKGIIVSYSGFEPDAIKLDFRARYDLFHVGHIHSGVGSFFLMGKGRIWFACPGYHITWHDFHTGVLIDGLGQEGWPALPGKLVEVRDSGPIATFAADAKANYDWKYSLDDTQVAWYPWKPRAPFYANFSFSDFYYDLSLLPENISALYVKIGLRERSNPVLRAFRTAALVRGVRPFVVIVDDIQKDTDAHLYKWVANGNSLVLNRQIGPTAAVFSHRGDEGAGKPRLLVQVLDWSPGSELVRPLGLEGWNRTYYEFLLNKNLTVTALGVTFAVKSVAPDFKVLLFPHLEGEALPTVCFSLDRGTFTWPDWNVTLEFKQEEGRTRVSLG